MKTISRTIEKCTIEAEVVYYNEEKVFIHEKMDKVITTDKEEKVRKNPSKYFNVEDGKTLLIESIKSEEKFFEVPVDEFIKLAESLEKKAEIKEENKVAEQVEKDLQKEA